MHLPDLKIRSPTSNVILRGDAQLELQRFLYIGATNYRADIAMRLIRDGKLGEPQMERCELLIAIKDEIITRLTAGHSPNSVPHYMVTLTQFMGFLDENQCSFSLEKLEANYLEYAEHLFLKSRSKKSTINEKSAYNKAATLSALFGPILTIPETVRLINRTRLHSSPTAKKAVNKTVEKQNLEATFKQGHFLVDLVAGLSADAIYGSLPLIIKFRSGLVEKDQIQLFAGLIERDWHSIPKDQWADNQIKLYRSATRLRRPVSTINGKGGGRRWRLVNLRVQAEFLIFLAQTGMNVAQAKELKRGGLKYKPLGDSWQVRCYKNRKGGEVSFRIYKSYVSVQSTPHFHPNRKSLAYSFFTKRNDDGQTNARPMASTD